MTKRIIYTPHEYVYSERLMRSKINLSIDTEVSREAKALGLNMSKVAEAAIAEAARLARNERWVAENQDRLDRYAAEVEAEGLPLSAHRTF